mgnify:CR=1 FL=1
MTELFWCKNCINNSERPRITFDKKGANEIVKNNYNGFKIKNNNYESFINYLNLFRKNKNYFKNRPYLSSRRYDLDKLVMKYIVIYNKLSKQ